MRLRNNNVFNKQSDTPTSQQRHVQQRLDSWLNASSPTTNEYSPVARARNSHPPAVTPSPANKRRHFHKSKGGYDGRQGGHRGKGGHTTQRKQRNNRTYSQNPRLANNFHYTSDVKDGYFSPNDSPPVRQSYVPTGMQTNRDTPNRNLTQNQYRKLKEQAKTILLTGANVNSTTRDIARNVALLAPSRFRAAMISHRKKAQFPVIWDSGASICVTPARTDFVSYKASSNVTDVKGVG